MAANVLGQGVDHDVRAVFERTAQEGRRYGVIDNQRNAVFVGNFGPLLDIHHVAGRVADRFAEQGAGLVVDGVLDCLEIIVAHHLALDALVRQRVGKQVVGAAIKLTGTDNVIADLADGLQGIGDGGHARSHRQGANAAFQRSHSLFQHIVGRVHDAGVNVALNFQIKQIGTVLGVIKGVGRGLVNRSGGGLGGRVALEAGVQRESCWFHHNIPCGWIVHYWFEAPSMPQALVLGHSSPFGARTTTARSVQGTVYQRPEFLADGVGRRWYQLGHEDHHHVLYRVHKEAGAGQSAPAEFAFGADGGGTGNIGFH